MTTQTRRHSSYAALANRRRSSLMVLPLIGFALVTLMVVGVIGLYAATSLAPTKTYSDCVVTDKDRVQTENGGSDMRVYTENCGILTTNDNLLIGQFDSAELYSSITVGKTYDFEAKGYRIPLLSMFPNIVTATPVNG